MRRPETALLGPERATLQDVDALNRLFSEAFTDRYHRDGLTGVRVPFLSREVWRYAVEDAGEGAMLWRDSEGQLAAFNIAHASGTEGWMGPLAVRPALQGLGIGRTIVEAGISWLRRRGAAVIGLETMPRTVENIGFYCRLGFVPGHLTLTLVGDLTRLGVREAKQFSTAGPDRAGWSDEIGALTARCAPGVDYRREVALTEDLRMGDTSLVRRDGRLVGFGLWHAVPLAQTRTAEEIRVLKVVAEDVPAFQAVVAAIAGHARGASAARRLAVRCQTSYPEAHAALLADGFRVQWTDLRMLLGGGTERAPGGVVMSNWEI
jgi:GNAT superfamily N-acetyltransferase